MKQHKNHNIIRFVISVFSIFIATNVTMEAIALAEDDDNLATQSESLENADNWLMRRICDNEWIELRDQTVNALSDVIRARLTRYQREGENPVYMGRCESDFFSCEERIDSLAKIVVNEAMLQDVDPWLVAAVAWKESRWNPFAEGAMGERGMIQLHPRNSRFSSIAFIHRESYRVRCIRIHGYCQEEVLREGIALLRDAMERCDDSVVGALTMYNTGHCTFAGSRYARSVLSDYRLMQPVRGNVALYSDTSFLNWYRHHPSRCTAL